MYPWVLDRWKRAPLPPKVTFATSCSSSLPDREEGRRRRMDFVDFWRSREGSKGEGVISGEGEGARLRQNLRLPPLGLGELDSSGKRTSERGVESLRSVRSAFPEDGAVRGTTTAVASLPPWLLLESLRRRERDALCWSVWRMGILYKRRERVETSTSDGGEGGLRMNATKRSCDSRSAGRTVRDGQEWSVVWRDA